MNDEREAVIRWEGEGGRPVEDTVAEVAELRSRLTAAYDRIAQQSELLAKRAEKVDRPVIVCLVGSTRFKAEYERTARDETLAGKIVLSVGMLGHQEGIDMNGPIKAMLDELHLRKIDLANEVYVVNPMQPRCPTCKKWFVVSHSHVGTINTTLCGCFVGPSTEATPREQAPYIGESTAREIAYAKQHGKVIRWLNEPDAS